MLQHLTIESFAIIDHVAIDFNAGMTVLSGETGAGKSIIIDALGILCGGRGSSEFIRQGSDKLVVEGLFTFDVVNAQLVDLLEQYGIATESLLADGLILRREITAQGKNIIRVNGQLINVTALKQIGAQLVDIHGQHEHQALLDSTRHLSLIDQLGDTSFKQLKAKYTKACQHYTHIRSQWLRSQKNEQEQLQRLSFLEFQVQEIEAANLELEEYEALESLSVRLQNATKIAHGVTAVNYLLSDGEASALSQLGSAISELSSIQSYDDTFPELVNQMKSMQYELQEVAHQIALSGNGLDDGDQSIDEVEARLDELGQLKRKYGMEIDEIIAYYHQISEEIYQVRHREDFLKELADQLHKAYQEAVTLAEKLSAARHELAQQLVEQIEKELIDLYMPHARFEVRFTPLASEVFDLPSGAVEWQQLNDQGKDDAEFYAMTNVGEVSKPLVKVASGGELSRFMLALKAVFSRKQQDTTMVFDEIDSGVSGRVAQAIAEKIAQIAHYTQVLCITHLAQVAAIADDQLYIQKQVKDERTSTTVEPLDQIGRTQILAQMIAGKTITDSSMHLAKELLAQMAQIRVEQK